MKVLLFCNLYPAKLGAYEHVLAAVSRELAAHDDELVAVFAAEPSEGVGRLFASASLRWHVIDGWSDGRGAEHPWRFCVPALNLLRTERPDVSSVHFGNELPCALVAFASKLVRVWTTRWVWEQDQQIRSPGRMARHLSKIRLVSMLMDRLVAVYEGGRESLRARGVAARKIHVIHNAVDDYTGERAHGWLHRELGLPPERLLLLCTSWFIPRKRVDFVLRAFARVCAAAGAADLVLVGDGPERESLESLSQSLGVSDRVHFLGRRNDVRDILEAIDVVVHASTAEGCPYAIGESLAAGVPAVVCRAGATPEQVAHEVSGYVLEQDDEDGFCDRLQELVSDADLRRRMGQAARDRWSERYRLEDAARYYRAVYLSACVPG